MTDSISISGTSDVGGALSFLHADLTVLHTGRDRPMGLGWRVDADALDKAFGLRPAKSSKARQVRARIAYDAQMHALRNDRRRISYSRSSRFWAGRQDYGGIDVGRSVVIAAVNDLLEAGVLVDHHIAPAGRAGGWQSSYAVEPSIASVEVPRARHEPGELVRMRDANGEWVRFRHTERTHRLRRFLEKVNAVNAAADIALADIDGMEVSPDGRVIRFGKHHAVSPDMKALYAVYNTAWTLGGRLYGGYWQNMRKEHRAAFMIDGCRTAEVDHEQLHPRLLYAYAGEVLDGDAYRLPGFEQERTVCKVAFNVLLNASGYRATQAAIAARIEGGRKPYPDAAPGSPRFLPPCEAAMEKAADLIEAVKSRHPRVRSLMHTGLGLRLQNVDAAMARDVLKEITVRRGLPCLPVHDSFVVREQDREVLTASMRSAFERHSEALRQASSGVGRSGYDSMSYGRNEPQGGEGRRGALAEGCGCLRLSGRGIPDSLIPDFGGSTPDSGAPPTDETGNHMNDREEENDHMARPKRLTGQRPSPPPLRRHWQEMVEDRAIVLTKPDVQDPSMRQAGEPDRPPPSEAAGNRETRRPESDPAMARDSSVPTTSAKGRPQPPWFMTREGMVEARRKAARQPKAHTRSK